MYHKRLPGQQSILEMLKKFKTSKQDEEGGSNDVVDNIEIGLDEQDNVFF